MADRKATLTFVARDAASGPVASIDRSLKGLGVSAGRTGTAIGGLGGVMGGITPAFLGTGLAIGALVGFLGNATRAAIEEETGIKRLGASLRANIPDWDGNTRAIEAQIAKRQELGFSDDDLRKSLALLVVATHDVGKAQEIQATAMDLARLKGIDLATASEALIRVEGGQFRALKGLGIELKANATQTEALAAVQAVAAGQAVEFGTTTAGAMAAASVAIDNLQEEIGAALAPAIKSIADVLRTVVVPALREFLNIVGTLAPVIMPVIAGIATVLTVKLVAALVATVGHFGLAAGAALGFGAATTTAAATATASGAAIAAAGNVGKLGWLSMFGPIALGVSALGALGQAFANIGIEISKVPTDAGGIASVEVLTRTNDLANAIRDLQAEFSTGSITVAEYDRRLAELRAAYAAATTAATDNTGATRITTAATEKAGAAIAAWTLREREATVATKVLTAATESNAAAMLEARNETLKTSAAQAELKKWLDLGADSAAEANNNLLDFASGANTAANDANTASAAARALQASLARIERNIRINIAFNQSGPTAGSAGRHQVGVGAGPLSQESAATSAANAAAAAAAAALNKVGSAHTGVGRAANEAAKISSNAFSNAAKGAERWFDSIHQGNLKAIKDAHARASAEIAAERRSVDTRLTERRRLNAEPVTAAEQALASTQRAQQERNLRESLGSAQQGTFNADTGSFETDQRAVRDAQESLDSFLAQVNIDRLRAEQVVADARAEQDAVNESKALDKRQVAADREQLLANAAEVKRHADQQKAYDVEATALEKHLGKTKASHSRVMSEISGLYDRFHIKSAAQGSAAGADIGTKLAAGLIASKAAVADAASELAEVIKRHLKVSSPAEAGPLHDDPPDAMGRAIVRQFASGARAEFGTATRTFASLAEQTAAEMGGIKVPQPDFASWEATLPSLRISAPELPEMPKIEPIQVAFEPLVMPKIEPIHVTVDPIQMPKMPRGLYDDYLGSAAKSGTDGSPITININGVGLTDPDEIVRRIMQALQRERQRQGISFA